MARISSISRKLAKGSKNSYQSLWIIVGIFLIAIILFAVFFPRRFHQGNPLVPEAFDNFSDLMENLEGNAQTVEHVDEILASTTPSLVMFYADWCPHCQDVKPDMEKLINEFNTQGSKVNVAMIDADKFKNKVGNYNVAGYPTIKFFPNGPKNYSKFVDYSGNREYSKLKDFIMKNNS